MLALIPADTGKPVAKLKRVPVIDGTCTWEEQVYEMVKLVKDQKTEAYKNKIYYFSVETGSSKSGFVGEVGVDFANFVDIAEPIQLSLPLTTSDNGAILHVFVQKMQRTDETRVFGENESQLSESFRSNSQASDSTENGNSNRVNKQRSSTDWSFGSRSDRSMIDIIKSPDYNYTESSKNEVHMLKRRAEFSELELESLRKQIIKESKRSQDLMRKMSEIKEELNHEKSLNKNIDDLHARLEVERKEKEELKIHIEDMSLDYNYLLQENNDMDSKYLTKIKEYELQIKRLEKELEEQRHEFEDDVQKLLKIKIDQEERVDQAEEALRKSTLINADAVEKLKDAHKQEAQKLCDQIDQMALEIEASKEHGECNYNLEKFNSLKKESTSWKSSVSEKNVMIRTLKLELKMVRGDYCALKEKLSVIESEKGNLQ
ncbi:uncharacterized protein LOC143631956 [Bidens hawaiensis]|uniref:uncharacterized protein LOC143631955 n=1 Tax=Bidens hawaiensis TaxID=980011 RepID=UPI00404ACF3F